MIEKVIIIGGGPAGLSAGIYLARVGLSPLIFAGSPPGGQLMLTSEVENFPSQKSILGPQLIEKMREQAKNFGAKIIDQNIVKVDLNGSEKKVYLDESSIKFLQRSELASRQNFGGTAVSSLNLENQGVASQPLAQTSTSGKNFIVTKTLIIATGAKALWLNVPGEERLRGKGVSACATCDGFFFREKIVAVVGGGDTALEEALTLTKFAKKVYIIHRRSVFRASKIMQDRVFKNKKIEIIWNSQVKEVLGDVKVKGVRLETDNQSKIIELEGLFVAIGHKPDTEIFQNQVKIDEKGYVITSQRLAMEIIRRKKQEAKEKEQWEKMIEKFDFNYQLMTSIRGVFAAGDCVDFQYRQAAIAAAMGVAAALEVEGYLELSI